MRFVEALPLGLVRIAALAALAAWVALLPACSSVSQPLAAVQRAIAPAAAKPGPEQAAAATPAERAAAAERERGGAAPVVKVPAAAASTAAAEPAAPIDARAQAAFDAARRALQAGRSEEAAAQLKALAASNPELGGVHANLGLLYRQAGKLPEAVAALERAVLLSPQQPVFHNQLGIAYRHSGQFAKAREAYERALALDPSYAAAVLNLGILQDLYLQDRKLALALYDQYLALSGGDATVTKWVADLKNRKDDRVAANGKPGDPANTNPSAKEKP